MKKNEIRSLPYAIHEDKLKMNSRPKCKNRNYQTLRGEHRQNTCDINQGKICDPPPRIMEIKTKTNKWDLIKLKAFAQQRKLQTR